MKRALVFAALAMVGVLGACSHARIVQREPSGRPSAPSRGAPARPAMSPLPADGVHVVRAGETLYGISFRYGLRFQDVAAWNNIADPYLIEVGERLRLSPSARVASASPPPSRPVATTPSRPPPVTPSAPSTITPSPIATAPAATPPPAAPTPRPGTPTAVTPRTPPPSTTILPPAAAPPPSYGASPPWRWPAQGEIVGKYVTGDRTQQGIDIAGSAGQDVVAAADGLVVYSGAGLVGYGELIIIKHSEEWLSAYAHNQKRLVVEGTRVTGGQVIARMGHTGAARDMLHFEIRRNGKPVDPLGQLPHR